ncbi:uncharacterized protein LOC143290122 isoform X2 [Babylonia areolata]|uniref:uncharacterized protein LOC143290122 isoform X2 n=1 Tax=Babylonia areolata TaxID=304850 RepID=UPI003FD4DB3A
MSDRDDDDGVQETCLDDIKVDEEGNLSFPECSADEAETDVDAVGVDEDGNLRIHSASRLLYMDESENQSEKDSDDGCSAEGQSRDRRHHAGDGTPEEEMGMLAMDSSTMEPTGENSSDAEPSEHVDDLGGIELTVFERPRPGDAGNGSQQGAPSLHYLERGGGDGQDGGKEGQSESKRRSRLRRLLDIAGDSKNTPVIAAVAIIVIGVLLTVGLLPASFVYVEYYELALAKSRVSGKVNRDDVYYPGCHLLTPDVELIRFQGTAHHVEKHLEIFTSDGLPFSLGITLQYFIKPQELGQLFTNYAQDYRPVVDSMIGSTIQNAGVVFSLDNFRLNRSHVERTLKEAVALTLSGNCCPSCCPYHCSASVDCRSCRLQGRGCTKGVHMEMKYFQMGLVDVPDEVSERFLRQTILLIEAEKELFVQQHAVETKISEKDQKDVLNKAAEIREAATAEAKKIRAVAEADYDKQVQMSYVEALKRFYGHLNITQEDHKLSFMYIRALDDISDNLYNLNYDKLTSFN